MKLSVVILTYDQEKTIARTIDSILEQQHDFEYEIIIGEDASPSDKTRAVCEDYVRRFPDLIKLMPKAPNKGLLRNYWHCLNECKGEYIAVCAGDDWWHRSDKIQMQVDFLDHNSDYGVCHTDANIFFVDSGATFQPKYVRNCPEGNMRGVFYFVNFIYACSVMYRKDLLKYTNFEEWIKDGVVAEDHAMWLSLAPYTKFHYIPLSTITYSITSESVSRSQSFDKRLKFIKGICQLQDNFYQRQKPEYVSKSKMLKHQRRWILIEILENKRYDLLSENNYHLFIQLMPRLTYVYLRIWSRIRSATTFLITRKKSISI